LFLEAQGPKKWRKLAIKKVNCNNKLYLCHENDSMNPASLYIHVPFCRRKCAYCDFYSRALGDRGDDYVAALLAEMDESRGFLPSPPDGRPRLTTVYFGGGTPSLLSASQLGCIFEHITRTFTLLPGAEITLEANPDDLGPDYLESLKTLPVNRLSIGIQSFDDGELAFIGRRHTARQAIEAVGRCREKGYGNISIDLMMGLPGQTPESFDDSLSLALGLGVQHISAYLLSLEPEVPLYRSLQKGLWQEADEELCATMYDRLSRRLTAAGFDHYEISNFALPGFRSRHNSGYWSGHPYLGLGPSAHSFDGRIRRWNAADLDAYLRHDFRREMDNPNREARYNELVMTRLRCREGIDLEQLRQSFGQELHDACLFTAQKWIESGDMQLEDGRLAIDPDSWIISDEIIRDLIQI